MKKFMSVFNILMVVAIATIAFEVNSLKAKESSSKSSQHLFSASEVPPVQSMSVTAPSSLTPVTNTVDYEKLRDFVSNDLNEMPNQFTAMPLEEIGEVSVSVTITPPEATAGADPDTSDCPSADSGCYISSDDCRKALSRINSEYGLSNSQIASLDYDILRSLTVNLLDTGKRERQYWFEAEHENLRNAKHDLTAKTRDSEESKRSFDRDHGINRDPVTTYEPQKFQGDGSL